MILYFKNISEQVSVQQLLSMDPTFTETPVFAFTATLFNVLPVAKEGDKRDEKAKEGDKRDEKGTEGEKRDEKAKEENKRDEKAKEGEKSDENATKGQERDEKAKEMGLAWSPDATHAFKGMNRRRIRINMNPQCRLSSTWSCSSRPFWLEPED